MKHVDWVIGITRNKEGKITHVFDSREKHSQVKTKNLLRYLLTGKRKRIMTNAGFAVTSGIINGVGGTAFTYMAIGTGTTPAQPQIQHCDRS